MDRLKPADLVHPDDRELVAASLRLDSTEALRVFQEAPDQFDLVVTDHTMPHLTGARMAVEMLKIRPDLPIVLCTDHSDGIDREKAKELGIRGFLMKP